MGRRTWPVAIVLVLVAASSASAGPSAAPGQLAPLTMSLPSISGLTKLGQQLDANPGNWTGPSPTYDYAWARCDGGGALCSSIQGANGQSYRLVSSDVGSTVRVIVTATNKNGSTVAASDATSVASDSPAPTPGTTTTTTSSTTTAPSTTTPQTTISQATTTPSTTSTPSTTTTQTTTSQATTTTPTTTTTTDGRVIFNGNFDTGNYSQWTWNAQCANTGVASDSTFTRGAFYAVSSVVTQGPFAGRFDLPASGIKSACEVLRQRTLSLGADEYYALDVRFPTDWVEPGGWGMTIAQLNFQNIWAGALSLVAHSDNVRLILMSGACVNPSGCQYNNGDAPTGGVPKTYLVPSGRLALGVWHQIIIRARWAADSSGVIEAWHRVKGEASWTKTVSISGFPTVQWSPGSSPNTNSVTVDKEGAYRGASTVPLSIWHDGFCIATTFSAAAGCL